MDHVEVVGEAAAVELHRIDDAHTSRDAGALQIARERERKALLIACVVTRISNVNGCAGRRAAQLVP